MEDKLRQSGFTPKEIKFITGWVRKEKSSYLIILSQLRSAFLGGILFRLLFVGLGIYSFFNDNTSGFYASLFACVFAFIIIEFFTPLITGAKIFIYLRKI